VHHIPDRRWSLAKVSGQVARAHAEAAACEDPQAADQMELGFLIVLYDQV
jgi:hypothetical protein